MDTPFPDLQPGKHLVIDNAAIADTYRLRRRVHQPRRDPVEPVMVAQHPWEGDYVTPLHVIHDAQRGRYRMWYQAHDMRLEAVRLKLGRSKYGNVGEPQPIYLCYAESDDGIRWERPALNVYPHESGDNAIVFKGYSYAAGNTIHFQPDAPPHQRYVMVNCEWFSEQRGGILFAFSPDGIHWSYAPPGNPPAPGSNVPAYASPAPGEPPYMPLIHGESDCWNSFLFNPERKVWMLYMRGWHTAAVGWDNGKGNARRRVTYAQSPDLQTWSEPKVIYTPDELDTNDFYGMQVFRYNDLYVGHLWLFDDDRDATIWVELAFSRDGVHWHRLPDRPKFIPAGWPDDGRGFMAISAQEPVIVGEKMYHYWTEHYNPHVDGKPVTKAYRGEMRLDGLVSLEAGLPMGNLVTRPFTLQNNQITINANTACGKIVAELVEPWWYDPSGKPIEGFAAKDFDVFTGNSVAHKLSWRGSADLRALRGRRVMLRMALNHAQIYSLTI